MGPWVRVLQVTIFNSLLKQSYFVIDRVVYRSLGMQISILIWQITIQGV